MSMHGQELISQSVLGFRLWDIDRHIENLMYKTLSLFSGAATPNEEGRQY